MSADDEIALFVPRVPKRFLRDAATNDDGTRRGSACERALGMHARRARVAPRARRGVRGRSRDSRRRRRRNEAALRGVTRGGVARGKE